MKTINSLNASWAILKPLNGVATKKDRKVCGEILLSGKRAERITVFSASKEGLGKKLKNLKGKLGKAYEVTVITDKQFGNLQNWNVDEIATSKQKEERYILN